MNDKVNTLEKVIIQNNLHGVFVANPDYEPPNTQGDGVLITESAKQFLEENKEKNDERFSESLDRVIQEVQKLRIEKAELNESLEKSTKMYKKLNKSFDKYKDEQESVIFVFFYLGCFRQMLNIHATLT